MAQLCAFIGVDRHIDPQIRDLSGAKRDAVALWSLFSDTVPGVDASLLVDADASIKNVRGIIQETVAEATKDDTVIVSFSCHGTRDHRIVCHDTDVSDLVNTTISMTELAEAFKKSKAKAILCLLDCCFAGGAPARVIDAGAVLRDIVSPLQNIAGEGRILFAASDVDEPACECPIKRHGLLSHAFMNHLKLSQDGAEFGEIADEVMKEVRANAAKLGHQQTPVFFGSVAGGFRLPKLVPGKKFFSEFPDASKAIATKPVEDLLQFGIPSELPAVWRTEFGGELNELQLEAVNKHRILDGKSLVVVAPTSSGKTFIGELAAAKAMADGRKTVFLLPYKALVNEKYDQFKRVYGSVGQRVIRATGDSHDEIPMLLKGKYDIAFLTYEMFLGLVVNNQSILHGLGLVVLDEAQFIADPNRGITVELLLTNLLAAREKGVCPQLITLSAVIGNLNNFDKWLDCQSLETDMRPVPLTEGVLDRNGRVRTKEDVAQLIPARSVVQRRRKQSSQDVIVPLVKQLVADGEKVIVFRNSRGSAQGCAKYLANELRLPSAGAIIESLPSHDVTSASSTLRESLSGGVAFHTSNLAAEERELVERGFRDEDGNIHVLVATTTVAAGINTPADTVIIVEHEFYGAVKRYFTIGEYKNMAGRAGRLGYRPNGKAILLADTPMQQDQLFARYVEGVPAPLCSSFDSKHIETWLLRLLSHVGHVKRADVFRLLANTFGGYLANREDPSWFSHAQVEAEKFVGEMLRLEIAEIDGDEIQLTILGRACADSLLEFRSSIRLIDVLRQLPPEQFTLERLMVLIQMLPESDDAYTPMFRKGQWEARWTQLAVSIFGRETAMILQRGARDAVRFRARCKRALILYDWLEGEPISSIESKFSANAYSRVGSGDVRSIASLTRLHLKSAFQIANAMLLVNNLENDEVERFLQRLEFGLPESALGLLEIPKSLSRGEYLALHGSGISKLGEFWSKLTSVVSDILGRKKADEFKGLRTDEIQAISSGDADLLR